MADSSGLSPMPIGSGGQSGGRAMPAAPAYAGSGSSWLRRILIFLGVVLAVVIVRNMVVNDYTAETKTYLKKIDPNDLMSVAYATGHPEIIDEIIPKTSDEIQAERKKQLKSLEELYTNMTIVMNELETMKHDIRSNKANIHDTDNYIINALHEIQGNITELSNKVNNS